jgi:3-oxoacyl-[acyl-carrier-protein] synthase II
MKAYIRSASCISPQYTFEDIGFLDKIIEYNETRLKAIEPDYKEFIDPKLIRRMSHIVKMGVTTALDCLNKGNIKTPGAIITGTAFGCLEDTVSFLTRTIELHEEMLSPTAFIQSTHNTLAAQIALLLKCHNYNNTFVHKGVSFENALIDGLMLLNENEADNILVGGTDELIDVSFSILTRLGLYKRKSINNLALLATQSKGTIGGEGSAFFLLSDKPSTNNMAELSGIRTFYKPENVAEIEQQITSFLGVNSLKINDIDLVVTGKNGDIKNDAVYHQLNNSLFAAKALANYKHLCGEYPTSSAFALWLAANIVKKECIPDVVIEGNIKALLPKKILIYNHYQNIYHSLMLISAC